MKSGGLAADWSRHTAGGCCRAHIGVFLGPCVQKIDKSRWTPQKIMSSDKLHSQQKLRLLERDCALECQRCSGCVAGMPAAQTLAPIKRDARVSLRLRPVLSYKHPFPSLVGVDAGSLGTKTDTWFPLSLQVVLSYEHPFPSVVGGCRFLGNTDRYLISLELAGGAVT